MIELRARDLKVGDNFTVDQGETWNEVESISSSLDEKGRRTFFVRQTTCNERGAVSVLSTKSALFLTPSCFVIVR